MVRPRGRNSVTAAPPATTAAAAAAAATSPELSAPPPEVDDTTRPPGFEDVQVASSSQATGAMYEQYVPSLYEQHYYRALAHLQAGGLPFDHFRGTVLGGRDGAEARGTEAASNAGWDSSGGTIDWTEREHNIQAAEVFWEAPPQGAMTRE